MHCDAMDLLGAFEESNSDVVICSASTELEERIRQRGVKNVAASLDEATATTAREDNLRASDEQTARDTAEEQVADNNATGREEGSVRGAPTDLLKLFGMAFEDNLPRGKAVQKIHHESSEARPYPIEPSSDRSDSGSTAPSVMAGQSFARYLDDSPPHSPASYAGNVEEWELLAPSNKSAASQGYASFSTLRKLQTVCARYSGPASAHNCANDMPCFHCR